jgi:hypothetical protein
MEQVEGSVQCPQVAVGERNKSVESQILDNVEGLDRLGLSKGGW